MRTIVLDAMGVLDTSADDVKDLLYPFIRARGGSTYGYDEVRQVYRSASLGEMSSSVFWRLFGIDPKNEVEYITLHRMTSGMREALSVLRAKGYPLWCLSNDVSEWSEMRMAHFGIREYFTGLVISGAVGFRKPEREIYEKLLSATGRKPEELLFVDDRPANLETASRMGMGTVLFTAHKGGAADPEWRNARNCGELLKAIDEWAGNGGSQ